jgi:N-acetyl-gamma-glutamyl-phosphate reductase
MSLIAEEDVRLTYTTQVVPACRGILSRLYGTLRSGISYLDVLDAYRKFQKGKCFVRIYETYTARDCLRKTGLLQSDQGNFTVLC